MVKHLSFFLIFLILCFFLAKGLFLDPREVPSPLIGKKIPSFSLPSLITEDKTITQDDLIGKKILLNVFASWCGPCLEEHPYLISLKRSQKIEIFGLNYKDYKNDAKIWLKSHGNPYKKIIYDPNALLGFDLGVYGVPETFLINENGIIIYKLSLIHI